MQSKENDLSLIHYLEQIPDHRRAAGRRHSLSLVLLIVIMAIMSGYHGYRAIGRFIERHRRTLIHLLSIPQARVPSYSAVRRVMMQTDYGELEKQFNAWASQYRLASSQEWVSVDGKALKNTVTDYSESQQNFVNVVSAFSHQRGLALGIKVIENKKQSEIEAVQTLLDILNLKNVVFTFDALHCQKKTLDRIIEQGNDYLVKVKANQPKLYNAIAETAKQQKPLKTYEEEEKTRNRKTLRKISLFSVAPSLDPKWSHARCVIQVERKGWRGQTPYHSISYYLSSVAPQSRRLMAGIRGHWLIENRLHWVKDVIYNEDASPQKQGFAPINLSLLKTWVLSLLRLQGYDSLTNAISSLSHNLRYTLSLCT